MLTTNILDGIFTEEDHNNRNTVVFQCVECKKWTKHKDWIPGKNNKHIACTTCGSTSYDLRSIKSLRSYNPLTDNKRKIK